MSTITYEEALAFAEDAHKDQRYKLAGGKSEAYINHVMRVVEMVIPSARIAALLHDCMEDAGRLPLNLSKIDRAALDLLTHDKEKDTYAEYIQKIATASGEAGSVARIVKISDLLENLSHIKPGHLEGLRYRYLDALGVLGNPPQLH